MWKEAGAPGGDRSDLHAEQELHRGSQKETTGTSKRYKSSCSVVPEARLDRRLLHPHRHLSLDSFPLVHQDALTETPWTSLERKMLPPSSLLPEGGPTCWAPQPWGLSHHLSDPTALPLLSTKEHRFESKMLLHNPSPGVTGQECASWVGNDINCDALLWG